MEVAPRSIRLKVRLTKKYAENIDGVDLADHAVGEMLDSPSEKGAAKRSSRRREHGRPRPARNPTAPMHDACGGWKGIARAG
jgi:hypothetical protein